MRRAIWAERYRLVFILCIIGLIRLIAGPIPTHPYLITVCLEQWPKAKGARMVQKRYTFTQAVGHRQILRVTAYGTLLNGTYYRHGHGPYPLGCQEGLMLAPGDRIAIDFNAAWPAAYKLSKGE